ncbi:MAG TPA: hypothetical protein PKH79_05510 [Prolixibacteraceae bacterium]|nr:hypothetical protein [Prolixibacteraceae bacterium]HPS11700.1 hypothetical protein [Prolixibacteraceae bacterium]
MKAAIILLIFRLFSFSLLLLASFFSMGSILTKTWESQNLPGTPTAIVYDARNEWIYVTNAGEKQGTGYISKIDTAGQIIQSNWISGFDHPQGLAIYDEKLFVTDQNQLKIADIQTGRIIETITVNGTKNLSGISIDINGRIYLTDWEENKILRITNKTTELWAESPYQISPAGITFQNADLFLLYQNYSLLYSSEEATMLFSVLAKETGKTERIEADGNGGFFIFDGNKLVHSAPGGEKSTQTLSDKEKEILTGMELIPSKKILIFSTPKKTIAAYRFQ